MCLNKNLLYVVEGNEVIAYYVNEGATQSGKQSKCRYPSNQSSICYNYLVSSEFSYNNQSGEVS